MKLRKVSELQLILTLFFVVALLVSNVITAKQVQLPLGITVTGAAFIFPLTYILSDVFSEVYGYRWSRLTSYMAFAANIFMVAVFSIAIATPAPDYWEHQEAFQTVLGNTPRVLAASLLAFLVGDYVNDKIFKKLKEKHPDSHKGFGGRAILSSFAGEVVDSLIFFPIVFLGQMPLSVLIVMMIVAVTSKTLYEVVILPVTRILVKMVSTMENQRV